MFEAAVCIDYRRNCAVNLLKEYVKPLLTTYPGIVEAEEVGLNIALSFYPSSFSYVCKSHHTFHLSKTCHRVVRAEGSRHLVHGCVPDASVEPR